MVSVYGYTRVSTMKQADEGESLGVQDRVIAGYLMMLGVTAARMFVESGVTASMPLADRPEGKALLACLKPGDVVITAKLDRMFRSALDALNILADFKARGIKLHMIDLGGDVTGDGISKMVFTILSAVAEAERDRIRDRISAVKADQKARGLYLGGHVPFGYLVVDGRLAPDPAQQETIGHIRRMSGFGLSLRRLKSDLGLTLSLDAISRIVKGEAAVASLDAATPDSLTLMPRSAIDD